jgi:PAS domain S-box-containing protein
MAERGSDDNDEQLRLLSREELEDRVHQRTSELEQVMDAMADILIKLDEQGNISMINGAVTDILGYEKATVEGKPVDILLTDPPEDHQSSVTSSENLLQRLLREGQVTDVEIYCSTAGGGAIPMSLSASTLEDDRGVPTGIVCVAKDISERKEAEERAEFLHSLLRHDLGNSLQVSKGFLEIIDEDDFDDTTQQYIDRSLNAVEDGVELIENVRTLSRIDGSESLKPVNLEETVSDALERHEGLQKEQAVTVEANVASVSVMGGKLLLEVFANLIENSLVHSGADTLSVTTTVDEETVTVHIEDDGKGIPPEKRDDIFQRGYSTGEESGSGLGMYIVSQLLDAYDGEVTVTDSEMGGARFDVTLELS